MTTVADEGNKRVGDMTRSEAEQCIQGKRHSPPMEDCIFPVFDYDKLIVPSDKSSSRYQVMVSKIKIV